MSDNFENLKEFVKAQLAFLLVTAGNSNIQLQYEENLVCYKIHKNNFANTDILYISQYQLYYHHGHYYYHIHHTLHHPYLQRTCYHRQHNHCAHSNHCRNHNDQ